MDLSPILIDYKSSPYSQKIRALCSAAKIPLRSCEQPHLRPRPTLENLGITYRRIPLLAIGNDIFCDSSLIIDVLQMCFVGLRSNPADKAYEVFGRSIFEVGLRLAPVTALTPQFVRDRETIFPILSSPNYSTLRPSALAELRACLSIVEKDFLGGGNQWINGDSISICDIHISWSLRWILQSFDVGSIDGFSRADFPYIYTWLDRFPRDEIEVISSEDFVRTLTKSPSFKDVSWDDSDPVNISKNERVSIEMTDATPGAHPQHGRLIGLNDQTATIELDNKLRIHFPRRGTLITRSETSEIVV